MPNYPLPNYTETGVKATDYKNRIDAAAAKHDLMAGQFYAHEADTPDMTVVVDAGRMMVSGLLVVQPQQVTAALVAPSTNPRIDRLVIDEITGALSVATGVEAVSPVAPDIPADKLACAYVTLSVGQTAITNNDFTDERSAVHVPRQWYPVLTNGKIGELLGSISSALWSRFTSTTLQEAGATMARVRVLNSVTADATATERLRGVFVEPVDAHSGLGTSGITVDNRQVSYIYSYYYSAAHPSVEARDYLEIEVPVDNGSFDYFVEAPFSPGGQATFILVGMYA